MDNNDAYAPLEGVYDEMLGMGKSINPSWENLAKTIDTLGVQGLETCRQEIVKQLEKDGATYHVYDDPEGVNRSWPVDPLPYLISSTEWRELESGLIKRGELYNLILKDLYGERTLLRDGVLPAELVWGNNDYALPCYDIVQAGSRQLPMFSVDLSRDKNGKLLVLGNRSQIPSGLGYARENRTVMTRSLSELYQKSKVYRLTNFFSTLRAGLGQLSPESTENPTVVLLTPGSLNETFFEHSYLAELLGIPIVRGEELFAKDGHIWLQTLDEPQHVDVILRRVDYDYCDPLEFKGSSLLGVPGLTEALRQGNVSISNPLGSGILESPALLHFLPQIAEHFGVPQTLEQIDTWWCGDENSLAHVLENFDEMVLKPVSIKQKGMTPVSISELNPEGKEKWRQRLIDSPKSYVAQPMLEQGTLPGFRDSQVSPCHAVLRTFMVAHDDKYHVMPGGLTRVSKSPKIELISSQTGSLSKDTWVISSDENDPVEVWRNSFHLLAESAPERRVSGSMAENLFWLGRYAERREVELNILRVIFSVYYTDINARQAILPALTWFTRSYPGFFATTGAANLQNPEAELISYLTQRNHNGGLIPGIMKMLLASREIRELLSSDMRSVIARVQVVSHELSNLQFPSIQSAKIPVERLKNLMLAFNGLAGQSMIQGVQWQFLDLGRRIERSLSIVSLLNVMALPVNGEPFEERNLRLLLQVFDNDVNYMHRYGDNVTLQCVLDLLLLEKENPKALSYQLERIFINLQELPGSTDIHPQDELLINEARSLLRLQHSSDLIEISETDNKRLNLRDLLKREEELLLALSAELSQRYFPQLLTKQQRLNEAL